MNKKRAIKRRISGTDGRNAGGNDQMPNGCSGLVLFGLLQVDRRKSAVPIRKSVTPEYIVCLEDGKKLKTLKRHLRSTYDMSPDEYRTKWGLPPEYPMVAPDYARARSEMAVKLGLGRKRG